MLTGYISGGTGTAGTVLKTIDGGNNWTVLSGTGNNWLFGIYFTDLQTGWTGGINGALLKTTDGGSNWAAQTSGTTNRIVAISFVNSNTGWTAGYAGTILSTINGGQNWTAQVSNTTENLWGVDFINANTGWAAGWFGTIVHTTNGGLTAITQLGNEVPEEFSLSQNYPNPFNPITNIKFNIPLLRGVSAGRGVLLVIYDALGKEIKQLVNEELSPGIYEVSWDASNYPSGVYFYKLSSSEVSFIRKMVLIK
jgi:photosystem II stability/assembly factor-like uncharacterized protein